MLQPCCLLWLLCLLYRQLSTGVQQCMWQSCASFDGLGITEWLQKHEPKLNPRTSCSGPRSYVQCMPTKSGVCALPVAFYIAPLTPATVAL